MAAIIAQMAAANRERKKRKILRKELPPSKSAYYLPSFDQCYDPSKHNRYVKRKMDKENRKHVIEAMKAKKLEEEEKQRECLEDKLWLEQLERCRDLVDPDSTKDEEEQVMELMRALEERDRKTAITVDVLKALTGIVFVAIFALLLSYLYVMLL